MSFRKGKRRVILRISQLVLFEKIAYQNDILILEIVIYPSLTLQELIPKIENSGHLPASAVKTIIAATA